MPTTTTSAVFSLQLVGIGFQGKVLHRDRTEEEVLGQRRTVIGTVRLIANDDQSSDKALGAGCPGGGKTRQGGSHNRKRLHFDVLFQIASYATTSVICNSVIHITTAVKARFATKARPQ